MAKRLASKEEGLNAPGPRRESAEGGGAVDVRPARTIPTVPTTRATTRPARASDEFRISTRTSPPPPSLPRAGDYRGGDDAAAAAAAAAAKLAEMEAAAAKAEAAFAARAVSRWTTR